MAINFKNIGILITSGLLAGNAKGQFLNTTIISTVQKVTDAAIPVKTLPVAVLPDEIKIAEADYERRQQEIELSMSKTLLSSMDLPPDHRRDILLAWFDQGRSALEQQEELSKSIEELYVRHGIELPAGPEPLPLAPLENELAALCERYADNPEDLRDAVTAWSKQNGIELGRVELAPPDSGGMPKAALSKPTVSGQKAPVPPLELPATGSLATMEQAMDRFIMLNPPPAADNVSTAAFEEWRDAVFSAIAEPMEKLNELRTIKILKLEQQTASENKTPDN